MNIHPTVYSFPAEFDGRSAELEAIFCCGTRRFIAVSQKGTVGPFSGTAKSSVHRHIVCHVRTLLAFSDLWTCWLMPILTRNLLKHINESFYLVQCAGNRKQVCKAVAGYSKITRDLVIWYAVVHWIHILVPVSVTPIFFLSSHISQPSKWPLSTRNSVYIFYIQPSYI
jgi:hypothetical protein